MRYISAIGIPISIQFVYKSPIISSSVRLSVNECNELINSRTTFLDAFLFGRELEKIWMCVLYFFLAKSVFFGNAHGAHIHHETIEQSIFLLKWRQRISWFALQRLDIYVEGYEESE